MPIASHKRGVLVLTVLNLAPGHELVLETLFSVMRRQNNRKTPDTQQVIGLRSPSNLNISHYQQQKNKLDIFSEEIGR